MSDIYCMHCGVVLTRLMAGFAEAKFRCDSCEYRFHICYGDVRYGVPFVTIHQTLWKFPKEEVDNP